MQYGHTRVLHVVPNVQVVLAMLMPMALAISVIASPLASCNNNFCAMSSYVDADSSWVLFAMYVRVSFWWRKCPLPWLNFVML